MVVGACPVELYLTPASISYLTQLILAVLITGYFTYRAVTTWRRGANSVMPFLLTVLFAFLVPTLLLFFLDAALPPSPRLYAVYLENPVVGLLLTLLTQFAYRFPQLYPQRRWEARLALGLNLAYTLWETLFALYRGRLLLESNYVLYRPHPFPDYALFACAAWVPVAFLRQAIAASQQGSGRTGLLNPAGLRYLWRPAGRAAQAACAFAMVCTIPLALSLLNIWRAQLIISPALFQSGMAAGLLLAQFLFALVYLNSIPETTTFQVRLVGIALVLVLAVLGAVGWALTPPHVAMYRPALLDRQTLRFTPNAGGGYDVTPVAFHFDADLGDPLDSKLLRPDSARWEAVAEVAFAFPFYGQMRQKVWVMKSGAVSMDAPLNYPNMEYHYGTLPAIFPLFIALGPTEESVFAKNTGERLTLTWNQLQAVHYPAARFTFQLVLYQDGVFEITTNGLSRLAFDPNTSPFVNVWVMGAVPGGRDQSPAPVNFTQAPLQGGPAGMIQDHYLEFRRYVHQLLLPLALSIVASSLFVIVSLPAVFYFNLIRPLNALVGTVRQMNLGRFDVAVQPQFPDEIGFLAETFNTMAAMLNDLVTNLETRVAERTRALNEATEQLRYEMAERDKAQTTVVQQQRQLATLQERERIGRELHDGLAQVLGYVSMQAQAIQNLVAAGQADAADPMLTQLARVAQEAHTDVRQYILGMRPAAAGQDLIHLLQDYAALLESNYGLRVQISAPDWPPNALTAEGEAEVWRIIQEALTNVRKHAGVSTAQVLCTAQADRLQIIIADAGRGFVLAAAPEADHLGLAIMRERVQALGGAIEWRTAPGQGTQVIVTIPRCAAPAPPTGNAERPLRVVIVDDHPLFVDGLRNLLTAHGIQVVGIGYDGCQAQELARLQPDIMLLDVNMPVCDGLQATQRIKTRYPTLKIVLLTVEAKEDLLFAGLQAGACGYLLKNLQGPELLEQLAQVMRGETVLSPELAARALREFAQAASATPAPAGLTALSPRQVKILSLLAAGLTYKEIAQRESMAERTVRYHVGQIIDLLQVNSRREAIALAIRYGLDKLSA